MKSSRKCEGTSCVRTNELVPQSQSLMRAFSQKNEEKLKCNCVRTNELVPQWQSLMRAFSQKNEEKHKCKTVEEPETVSTTQEFSTGSSYDGEWNEVNGMHGYGVYKFPNGIIYEGQFKDGMMHGKGELRYDTTEAVIRGIWKKGIMTERKLFFRNTLEYNEESWKYCKMPDRRFALEYDTDLMFPSLLTNNQPTINIPHGYYDTEDGFYDSEKELIYKHDDLTAVIRGPSVHKQKWILNNCRGNDVPVGPRRDLYERFFDPVLQLPKPTPTSHTVNIRTKSADDIDFEQSPPFYDASKYDG